MDLINAAERGNTDECERLLLSGVSPNSSNEVFARKNMINFDVIYSVQTLK